MVPQEILTAHGSGTRGGGGGGGEMELKSWRGIQAVPASRFLPTYFTYLFSQSLEMPWWFLPTLSFQPGVVDFTECGWHSWQAGTVFVVGRCHCSLPTSSPLPSWGLPSRIQINYSYGWLQFHHIFSCVFVITHNSNVDIMTMQHTYTFFAPHGLPSRGNLGDSLQRCWAVGHLSFSLLCPFFASITKDNMINRSGRRTYPLQKVGLHVFSKS